MNLYDYKQDLLAKRERYEIVRSKFSDVKTKLTEINEKLSDSAVWKDLELVTNLNKKKSTYEKTESDLTKTGDKLNDYGAILELMEEGEAGLTEEELVTIKTEAEQLLQSLWIKQLLNKPYDDGAAVLSLHPGAGGEEAQDWAEMLSRMYIRYSEKQGYTVSVLDYQAGDGAGIKSMTMLIDGAYAYGYLKTEKGVHRLVRLSPFDANNRRHTSFASVEVAPFVSDAPSVEIKAADLRIDTYRSSGAGGQHVNKTESAIRITHLPTGIVVQCQNERSQLQNKEMAMSMLYSKLVERELAEKEKQRRLENANSKKIEWGSQIRSYVLHPYNLVKDHRTGEETANTTAVLNGEIQAFINAFLKVDN